MISKTPIANSCNNLIPSDKEFVPPVDKHIHEANRSKMGKRGIYSIISTVKKQIEKDSLIRTEMDKIL
ncbi:hypothetical protein AC249_AIPGENE24775 [Exaiptasia diaphana]|nr:hypothetical protein AC249_AIPGENE24775 [Exaiptasia diaphana]